MPKRPTILIADDNAAQRKVLELFLRAYDVASAQDGQEALDYLKQRTPDLMILDITMPFVNGIEVCERVKRGGLRHVPVIMLTSLTDDRTRAAVKAAGADLHLAKPVTGTIQQTVSRLLNPRQGQA